MNKAIQVSAESKVCSELVRHHHRNVGMNVGNV